MVGPDLCTAQPRRSGHLGRRPPVFDPDYRRSRLVVGPDLLHPEHAAGGRRLLDADAAVPNAPGCGATVDEGDKAGAVPAVLARWAGWGRVRDQSAASFLIVPEIVSHSYFVALVPERLVRDRRDELKIVECPFPVPGFTVSMLWHERNHGHSGQRWVRETAMEVTGSL